MQNIIMMGPWPLALSRATKPGRGPKRPLTFNRHVYVCVRSLVSDMAPWVALGRALQRHRCEVCPVCLFDGRAIPTPEQVAERNKALGDKRVGVPLVWRMVCPLIIKSVLLTLETRHAGARREMGRDAQLLVPQENLRSQVVRYMYPSGC